VHTIVIVPPFPKDLILLGINELGANIVFDVKCVFYGHLQLLFKTGEYLVRYALDP
jgi:hypothetical protein